MIEELVRVLVCLALGEALARTGLVPIPGAVIGLVLLYLNLTWLDRVPDPLGGIADRVLQNFGLLFVPAGVGVVAYLSLLRTDFAAIVAAIVGGTAVTIGVTAFAVDRLAHSLPQPMEQPTHA